MRQHSGAPTWWCCEICSVMLPRDVWPASGGSTALRLEPLYRIRFTYQESWMVELEGGSSPCFSLRDAARVLSVVASGARTSRSAEPQPGRSVLTFAPPSIPTTARQSWSSGRDMAAPTHRVDGRSSAASFTSATANATAGSTTLYACV